MSGVGEGSGGFAPFPRCTAVAPFSDGVLWMKQYYVRLILTLMVTVYCEMVSSRRVKTLSESLVDCSQQKGQNVPNLFLCGGSGRNSTHRPFALIHIPKTATTTMHQLLLGYKRRMHHPREIFSAGIFQLTHLDQFNKLDPSQQENVVIMKGKRAASLELESQQLLTMGAIFRHPVARMMSYYSYIKGHAIHYPLTCTIDAASSFESWYMQHRNTLPDIDNYEANPTNNDRT